MKSSDVAYLIHIISQQGPLPDNIKRLKEELQQAHKNAQAKGLYIIPIRPEITIESDF